MENTSGTKRRGRPPKEPSDVKRHNVTVVMTGPMRDRIRDVAEANGRSVSSEIDFRLGMSLALEDDTGSASVRRLIDFTRLAALKLEQDAGKAWPDDEALAQSLIGVLQSYIQSNSPQDKLAANKAAGWKAMTDRMSELRTDMPGGPIDQGKLIATVLQEFEDFFSQQTDDFSKRRDIQDKAVEATKPLVELFRVKPSEAEEKRQT